MRSDSPIAQSVERRTVNPQVPGSSPGGRAKILKSPSIVTWAFFITHCFDPHPIPFWYTAMTYQIVYKKNI